MNGKQTEDLIVKLRNEVVRRGAQFFVVSLSTGIQVHPNPVTRANFIDKLRISDLFYPERRLQALAAREKFDVITLGSEDAGLCRRASSIFARIQDSLLGRGHWSEKGHQLAGQLIASDCQTFLPIDS